METGSTIPEIQWDESGTEISRPDACSVDSTREEIFFLFGMYRAEDIGQTEMTVDLQKRIIVSPFVAKRLSKLLADVLRDHEYTHGPLNEEPASKGGPPGHPALGSQPVSGSKKTSEPGQTLFQIINNLDLTYGYERSFKMYDRTLLGNRFLLTFDRNSLRQLPPERILELCGQINMPRNLSSEFSENLPQATCVHFGFEENKGSCIYKAYLEFPSNPESGLGRNGAAPAPFLLYLGFKWDTSDNTRQAVSRYSRYPLITVENILERVSNIYGGARCPYEVVKGITDIASARIGRDDILYLEVTEDNNPRRSFDINMYFASLLVGELYPLLARIGQHYGLSFGDFHGLYDGVKDRIFGHVSGGIDREGKDFLTIYHGMQAFRKQEAGPAAQPGARQRGRAVPSADSHFSGVENRDKKAVELFEFVKGLNVPVGIEHSFKALEKSLLPDRFLIGFQRVSLWQDPDESILNICRRLGMPEPFQATFRENLSEANVVLFGFERSRNEVVYKAYLEFGAGFKKRSQADSGNGESVLMHLGFKWNVSDDSQKAVAQYRCFPMLTEKDMLERLSSKDFFKDERKGYLAIVEAILNLAVCRTHPYEFIYLEAEEDGNQRTSFDINLYRANLRMSEVYPHLLEIGRYFSIPREEYHRIYEASRNQIFGHIQAGIDRAGREFFTVYYGGKGKPRKL